MSCVMWALAVILFCPVVILRAGFLLSDWASRRRFSITLVHFFFFLDFLFGISDSRAQELSILLIFIFSLFPLTALSPHPHTNQISYMRCKLHYASKQASSQTDLGIPFPPPFSFSIWVFRRKQDQPAAVLRNG